MNKNPKESFVLYEVAPSLTHDNKKIKILADSFATIFDTDKLFGKEVITYEIYGNDKSVHYLFGCPESSSGYFRPKLENSFKGSSVHVWQGDEHNGKHTGLGPCAAILQSGSYHGFTLNLKQPSFLPLDMKDAQIYEEILSTMDSLEKNEKLLIQIIIRPLSDDWQNDCRESYEAWLNGETIYRGVHGKQMLQGFMTGAMRSLQNMAKLMSNEDADDVRRRQAVPDVKIKLTQPGFNVQIRGLVAATPSRQTIIARSVASAFRNLSKENDFKLNHSINQKRLALLIEERKISVMANKQIISSLELSNMIKVPDGKCDNPKIQRTAPEERRVDEGLTKHGMLIGHTVHTADKKPVHFSVAHADDVARVKLFVASPGGGKSTIIEQLVFEAAKLGHGAVIFDIADGKLYERVIQMLPEYKDKLVCIDYTDEIYPPAFNFSALGGSDDDRGMIFAEFFEMLFKTDDLARTQSYLNKAALSVFADNNATLLEFLLMLRDADFRNSVIPNLRTTHPDLYLWWMKEFPKISEARWNENVAPIIVRLDNLFYNTRMRNILCQRGGKVAPAEWMKNGNIVVVNLSNGTFTEPEQRMLMALHNYAFWNATLAREKETRAGLKPRPFHLIYDEPQTYMNATPMVSRAISKARKYGTSLSFFIQEAEQIIKEAPALWKEILGMSPHLMIGPVSESTAKHIKKELNMSEEEILAIKNHKFHWIMKTYVKKEAVPPIVIKAMPPRDERDEEEKKKVIGSKHTAEVKLKWRTHFSRQMKSQLQADISARNMGLSVAEYHKLLNSYAAPKSEEVNWDAGDKKEAPVWS